jgi:hypothetical protein
MPYKDPDKKRAAHKEQRKRKEFRESRPTIETDAPEDTATRTCPACNEIKPLTHFEFLPADHRCTACVPVDVTSVNRQKLIDLAQRKLAQIFDANERAVGLPALEQLLNGIYGAWGGVNSFCHDIKDNYDSLVEQKKFNAAANVQLGVMKLHARVDKMKLEDDWRTMDDDRLKESLQLQLMHLMADEEKLNALATVMKAHNQDPQQVLYGVIAPDE